MPMSNNNIILVSGASGTGKSACLRNLKDPEGVLYLCCENNKALPFANEFRVKNITDPHQVQQAFTYSETKPEIHTVIVDTMTFMMDMFESLYVLPLAGTKEGQAAWGKYAEFFKTLMSQYVSKSTKKVIFLGHTADEINDDRVRETRVKVKGSLMARGIESFFTIVISTKVMEVSDLETCSSDLLDVSEDDEIDGFKYCFQTRLVKGTTQERIRSPMGMWSRKETYIDNDIQKVFGKLDKFYRIDEA